MKKFVLVALSCMLVLTGCTHEQTAVKQTEKQTEKQAALTYYLAGRIQASAAADLSVPYTGKVESVLVHVGQSVKAGDSLISFDRSEVSAQEEVTKQALNIALATLEKAKSGARPEQLLQAEATVKSAQVARDNAANNLERQQAVYDMGSIAKAELEVAQGQVASTEAALKNAEEALAILNNGETKAYLAVLERQVAQAKAAVSSANITLENRIVKAPFDGVIVSCPAKNGETYLAQTVLVSLENRGRLTVDAYGPASTMENFKVGEKVRAGVAELENKELYGTVTWIGQTVDTKRRDVLVKISLEPNANLMAGMFTEIAPIK